MKTAEFLFGLHAVQTKLQRNPQQVQQLWVQQGREDQRLCKLQMLAAKHHIIVHVVPRKALDQRVTGRHQGVVAACTPSIAKTEADLKHLLHQLRAPAFLLVLDGVTDPHNLGACLRTADAAGVHAVITAKDQSASLNSTVAKVACGAVESIPFVQVTNLVRCLKYLQDQGVWVTGTADNASKSVYHAHLNGPMALVMGGEGRGLRRLTRASCDQLVAIPMAGQTSSLNVSVATGVCVFEAVRQRNQSINMTHHLQTLT